MEDVSTSVNYSSQLNVLVVVLANSSWKHMQSFDRFWRTFSVNIFYFNFIQVMYRIQIVYNSKRIWTEARGLFSSSPVEYIKLYQNKAELYIYTGYTVASTKYNHIAQH